MKSIHQLAFSLTVFALFGIAAPRAWSQPIITKQPADQFVDLAKNVSLSVSSSTAPPLLTYQWFFNGSELLGATNRILTLANAQPTNNGDYFVLVSNPSGSVTSQVARLLTCLKQQGISAHTTAEPSTGPIGRLLRSLLGGADAPVDPAAMALLFAADRRDHLAREVLPHLGAGTHVICDRYALSSLVYQVAAGAERDLIAAANAGVRRPDLTILVAVPAEVAAGRREKRSAAAEIYETDDTQRAVAAAYLEEARLAQGAGDPIALIDGRGTLEEVAEAVLRTLRSCLDDLFQARS